MNALNDKHAKLLQDLLRHRHNQLRWRILKELNDSDSEHHQDIAGQVHDLEDDSLANLLVDINMATLDRDINEIRDIEAALLKLRQDTYGNCEDCGEPIELSRLMVAPQARRCSHCQTKREHRLGPRGRSSL